METLVRIQYRLLIDWNAINAKDRFPSIDLPNNIFAARWLVNIEPLDILGYDEMCIIDENTIRLGDTFLSKLEWLEETIV